MEFSLFGGQKQNEELVLIIDIGSASVGAALAKIENTQAPKILYSIREDISFQEVLSSARFLLAMNKALDKVLKNLYEKTKLTGTPEHFFCTLSSPWFILKTRELKIATNEEFDVTERALEKFIDEDILKLKDELKGILPPEDVKIIEKKIIHIRLNGYEIKNPYKQKTSRMEMVVTIGVSSSKVIQSIERKINNFFHTKRVHFGAFPVAAFSAIRDIFPTESDFIFLDITGEATDVSRVENDLLMRTVSFPRGKNFFIREISSRLRTVYEEATTLFSMFLRGELNTARQVEVSNIVETAEIEWQERFKKAITSLLGSGVSTRKIFFTTDVEISSRLINMISKTKYELLPDTEFDVQYLDQHIVSSFVTFEKEVIRDPFIVIEVLLVKKLLTQHI